MCDCTAPLCKECQAKEEREWDALEFRVKKLEAALTSIRSMTEELAHSKYAKAAHGETLGAEINLIATKALSR